MKARLLAVGTVILFAVLLGTTVGMHGQATTQAPSHDHQPDTSAQSAPSASDPSAHMMSMMNRMKATGPELDALVKKMNAASGSAKTDAMAELLTALVNDRRNTCEPMMADMAAMMNMMPMMNTMGGRGRGAAQPQK